MRALHSATRAVVAADDAVDAAFYSALNLASSYGCSAFQACALGQRNPEQADEIKRTDRPLTSDPSADTNGRPRAQPVDGADTIDAELTARQTRLEMPS
eukprot:3190842-Pleurochrysis_carterae.AAC.1